MNEYTLTLTEEEIVDVVFALAEYIEGHEKMSDSDKKRITALLKRVNNEAIKND